MRQSILQLIHQQITFALRSPLPSVRCEHLSTNEAQRADTDAELDELNRQIAHTPSSYAPS